MRTTNTKQRESIYARLKPGTTPDPLSPSAIAFSDLQLFLNNTQPIDEHDFLFNHVHTYLYGIQNAKRLFTFRCSFKRLLFTFDINYTWRTNVLGYIKLNSGPDDRSLHISYNLGCIISCICTKYVICKTPLAQTSGHIRMNWRSIIFDRVSHRPVPMRRKRFSNWQNYIERLTT